MLYWAKEQSEEKSPMLTQFTMHFNNVSQWWGPHCTAGCMWPSDTCVGFSVHPLPSRTKTRILERGVDMRVRVKVVLHFVGIMKVLFSSYSNIKSLNWSVLSTTQGWIYTSTFFIDKSSWLFFQALRDNFNNFNSYLAILSAIESSPISRLDWPDRVIKSLEEPRALIDNKGSFKNYREAFARAKPPCIPYMWVNCMWWWM